MSNINNKTQELFALNAVQDLDNESAATIAGGAAVELFVDDNFTRPLLSTDSSISNVGPAANDETTSAIVNEGTWLFCVDDQFRGCQLVNPGRYPNLQFDVGLPNDSLTSLQRIG